MSPTTATLGDTVSSAASPAVLLDGARAALARQRVAEVEVLVAVADWADAHTEDGEVANQHGPFGLIRPDAHLLPGADVFGELGGPGAPLVSEFCVVEIAAALGLSTDSGRRLVGEAVELRHRLPRLWNRVVDGVLPAWRARKIAQETTQLTPDGAEFVDRHLAPVAHKTGMVTAQKLVAEAVARFDPEKAELDRADSDATRRFDIDFDAQVDPARGVVPVSGTLDLADALDLENAVSRVAADLAVAGSLDSLDARRSSAVGEIARRQTTLDLSGCDNADAVRTTTGEASNQTGSDTAPAATRSKARQVVLHVHLAEAALTDLDPNACGGVDLARVEKTRSFVLAEQVREWCRSSLTQVVVKPVIDLRDQVAVDAYEIPDRIAERVRLTRPTCVFPHCTRPARGCDLDHVDEYVRAEDGGPPGQTSTTNLAPLCRRHHRVKTHPSMSGVGRERRWRYRRLPDGSFIWTSPHDHQYLVDPHGTIPLPPDRAA
ncbi:HNH endonuclease signature motif containing protein [Nocardioides alkalitolerans]|uniref:HNH endonuclease signature motif containing protein n=1 Tax=Nocardioides alkalitolerans TaxID=281714 RepID=UPI0004184ABA|nr:HNH endonuclease signature motif containing protein [Nocardioides alkalitolerans]